MQDSKLHLDWDVVADARRSAKNIAIDVQTYIDDHSTVSVERTICRLLGIDGMDKFEVPTARPQGSITSHKSCFPYF